MLRDDDTFPMASQTLPPSPSHHPDTEQQIYTNDNLDDVFGSAPPSPTFGSDSEDLYTREERFGGRGNDEVSDIPRLKEKHETEGYRDGVGKGKGESVQQGFDEGYSLGAILGLRIGKVLGLLEGVLGGVCAGLRNEGGEGWAKETERVEGLWRDAEKELGTQNVFGREYWGKDGIWIFEVPSEKKEGQETDFRDVAAAHPLIVKWENIMAEEVERWRIDLNAMDGEHDEEMIEGKDGVVHKKMPTAKGPAAEYVPAATGNILGVAKEKLSW